MKKLLLALVLALFAFHPPGLEAQDLTQVYRMTPRSGSAAAVQAALQAHSRWRADQGDPWSWVIFEEVQGADLGDWIALSAGHTWEDLDAYDQGFGPRGGQHFNGTVAPLLEEVRSEILVVDPDLTNQPPDAGETPYTLFHVTRWTLVTTRQPLFNEAVGRIIQSYGEGGAGYYRTYYDVFVGPTQPQKIVSRWYRDWADFNRAPAPGTSVTAAFGQDEATEVFDAFRQSVASTQEYILRVHPEMSVQGSGM